MLKHTAHVALSFILLGSMLVEHAAAQTPTPETTLFIDGWWSGDMAKLSCEQARAFLKKNAELVAQVGCNDLGDCPFFTAVDTACVMAPTPESLAHDWEDAVSSQFALNDKCSGLSVVWFGGPGVPTSATMSAMASKPPWVLIVDYVPGHDEQSFTIGSPGNASMIRSSGSAKKAVNDTCLLMKAKGGAIIK